MPRIILDRQQDPRAQYPEIVADLANELRANRRFGQPVIREQRFPATNAIRITVVWDRWEPLSDEERVAPILQAYVQVEGEDFRDRVALAIGLTVPEAHDAGLLPFQVTAALRPTDPVTPDQCRAAMLELGASVLGNPDKPVLRFATAEEAEQCVRALVERLPESEQVWIVAKDVSRIAD